MVFCYCVSDHHKLGCLKQHTCVILQCLWLWTAVTAQGVLFGVSPGCCLGVRWGCGLIRLSPGEGPTLASSLRGLAESISSENKPAFLLATSQELLSTPGGRPQVLFLCTGSHNRAAYFFKAENGEPPQCAKTECHRENFITEETFHLLF